MNSCTPSPKAAKLIWAKQLIRLPFLVVCVKCKFVYTAKSKMGSQLLLAPPVHTSNCDGDLKKAFNECLGVSNVFTTTA